MSTCIGILSYLIGILGEAGDIIENDIRLRKERILSSQRTRATIYRQMNPELVVHPMYYSNDIIDDDFRIAFTRFRLSSHRLKIETGRWARIPQERRFCPCGVVQTEKHVLCECPLVNDICLFDCTPSQKTQTLPGKIIFLCLNSNLKSFLEK